MDTLAPAAPSAPSASPVSPAATPASPSHRPRPSAARGRSLTPLHADDLSGFTKRLRTELAAHLAREPGVPSHVQLLNMLARAAGHRNVQALKASPAQAPAGRPGAAAATVAPLEPLPATDAGPRAVAAALPSASDAASPATALSPTAQKALSQFDSWGRLQRWPTRFSVQRLAMWGLWLRFDGARTYTEREVNEILKAWVTYGDHVTPRRELVEMGLLGRKPDCSSYWKEPRRPEDEVRALLQALRLRRP